MLTAIIAKLPMRNKPVTRDFYTQYLGFQDVSSEDYEAYLILERDGMELHFFLHETLVPSENDGQIYLRSNDIDMLYQSFLAKHTPIHPNGALSVKPWGQKEFSVLDPDHNLLTFGQNIA
jgi:catechol 2,3-dioxygenase-like lactoylglutathione lyase family enzyme